MKTTSLVIVFVLVLSFAAAASEWVPLIPGRPAGSQPEINVISSSGAQTQVEVLLPGFYVRDTAEGRDLYVPGWGQLDEVGLPALPRGSLLFALPSKGAIRVNAAGEGAVTFEGYEVRPAPEPGFDGKPGKAAPSPRPWKGIYPERPAVPATRGFLGALPVCSVLLCPFEIDASTGILTVYPRMTVTVHHGEEGAAWPHFHLTGHLAKICSRTVVNFGAVPLTAGGSSGAPAGRGDATYVFIVKSGLETAIQPLVEWRQRTGFKTDVQSVTNPSAQQVKNIILGYPDVEYVLLVGDSNDIPMASWSGIYGDHWYACTTGGSNPDIYADLSIGRLCGSDSGRITPQVNRILDYEKSPPLGNWLKNTILVAHRENYPYKYTQCKNDIATNMSSSSDWTVVKYYGGESGKTNAGLTQLINGGVNILNYRGHGDTQEWWSWNLSYESFTNTNVMNLGNGDMRPVVFNIACNNGNIASYCLCEAWLDAPGGATAALGATEPSYTEPNHTFDKALYEAVFNQGITDIGGMLDYADNVIAGVSYGEYNIKMYLWLGDPAMNVWLNVPANTMDASYTDPIQTGSQTFDVYVSSGSAAIQGATVCAFKDGEVSVTGTTGSGGHAYLTINPLTPGVMYVTVTDPDYLPYEGFVTVGGSSNPIPDIRINGQNGPLQVSPTQIIDITISLYAGTQQGVPHDWWVFGERNWTDDFWWKYPNKWIASSTPIRAYNGPLIDLNDFLITSGHLPTGFWTFTFAVDTLNNTYEGTYLDTIDVQSW